jgi:hypothetical protein
MACNQKHDQYVPASGAHDLKLYLRLKLILGFINFLVGFSHRICMGLLDPLIFFNLYGLVFSCFYVVLVVFLALDLKIGERKYIKIIIFSLKYMY